MGDAFSIARNNEASIISTAGSLAKLKPKMLNPMPCISAVNMPSLRSCKVNRRPSRLGIAGGHACGFVVNYYGKQIYFAGDTGLFGDMKLIGELNALDLALLPIGDNFTMGIEDAALAASFLKAPLVIPFHYNTWPVIQAVPEEFKQLVEKKTTSRCLILAPGESYSWE